MHSDPEGWCLGTLGPILDSPLLSLLLPTWITLAFLSQSLSRRVEGASKEVVESIDYELANSTILKTSYHSLGCSSLIQ